MYLVYMYAILILLNILYYFYNLIKNNLVSCQNLKGNVEECSSRLYTLSRK